MYKHHIRLYSRELNYCTCEYRTRVLPNLKLKSTNIPSRGDVQLVQVQTIPLGFSSCWLPRIPVFNQKKTQKAQDGNQKNRFRRWLSFPNFRIPIVQQKEKIRSHLHLGLLAVGAGTRTWGCWNLWRKKLPGILGTHGFWWPHTAPKHCCVNWTFFLILECRSDVIPSTLGGKWKNFSPFIASPSNAAGLRFNSSTQGSQPTKEGTTHWKTSVFHIWVFPKIGVPPNHPF